MSYLDLNLEKEFLGKRIIVTGASRGLGAMACEALAKRGAKIAMLSRSKKEMDNLKNGLKKNTYPILVSGATGGVGILSICILSRLGFRVCAITGKPEQESFLKEIGASEIIHRNEFSSYPEMPLLKVRFAGIIDNIGGDIISSGSRQLVEGGKIAAIGMTSNENFQINLMPFILRGIQIIGINAESTDSALRKKIWKEIVKISKEKTLKLVYQECNIHNSINIIKKIKNNTNVGRVIVRMI